MNDRLSRLSRSSEALFRKKLELDRGQVENYTPVRPHIRPQELVYGLIFVLSNVMVSVYGYQVSADERLCS